MQSDVHKDRCIKGTAIPRSLRNVFIRLCICLSAWLGRYFFVVVGFGWGFLTFVTLKPWMCGNSRSLAAWSECHSVFVKISHKSHMQKESVTSWKKWGFLLCSACVQQIQYGLNRSDLWCMCRKPVRHFWLICSRPSISQNILSRHSVSFCNPNREKRLVSCLCYCCFLSVILELLVPVHNCVTRNSI